MCYLIGNFRIRLRRAGECPLAAGVPYAGKIRIAAYLPAPRIAL